MCKILFEWPNPLNRSSLNGKSVQELSSYEQERTFLWLDEVDYKFFLQNTLFDNRFDYLHLGVLYIGRPFKYVILHFQPYSNCDRYQVEVKGNPIIANQMQSYQNGHQFEGVSIFVNLILLIIFYFLDTKYPLYLKFSSLNHWRFLNSLFFFKNIN